MLVNVFVNTHPSWANAIRIVRIVYIVAHIANIGLFRDGLDLPRRAAMPAGEAGRNQVLAAVDLGVRERVREPSATCGGRRSAGIRDPQRLSLAGE